MSLNELYQEIILDHAKHPRNAGELEGATHCAEGYNPLCGDQVKVELRIEEGRVAEARFVGSGCAISTASASMMTQAIRGQTLERALEIAEEFQQSVTVEGVEPGEDLGELAALSGVKAFPSRVKCATLVWHALQAALDRNEQPVSTEE